MRRRLFNLAAAVSLVLCVATAVLWVRGHRVGDCALVIRPRADAPGGYQFVQFWSAAGGMRFMFGEIRGSAWSTRPSRPHFAHDTFALGPKPYPIDSSDPWAANAGKARGGFGFEIYWRDYVIPTYSEQMESVTLPCWFLMLTSLILPGVLLRRVARWALQRHRIGRGLCPTCGYDLRATPGRCPECGAESNPQPAQGAVA